MAGTVRHSNGVVITTQSGDRVACDGTATADATVLSHAHTDHLIGSTPGPVLCSPITAALAAARRTAAPGDHRRTLETESLHIELVDAGHVIGSRAALVTDLPAERTYLYTGDISTRDRLFLDGFDPPSADVLIIEATYGKPRYRFPPTDVVVRAIHSWLDAVDDRVAVLFGYPLGRAQTLQRIAADGIGADRGVFVHPSIAELNAVITEHGQLSLDYPSIDGDINVKSGDVVILPGSPTRSTALDRLAREHPVTTAGVSGWAIENGFRYRGDYDKTFPLSDHCDFSELLAVVEAVDPAMVFTTHGFATSLAEHVRRSFGIDARPLKRNQTTLTEF